MLVPVELNTLSLSSICLGKGLAVLIFLAVFVVVFLLR